MSAHYQADEEIASKSSQFYRLLRNCHAIQLQAVHLRNDPETRAKFAGDYLRFSVENLDSHDQSPFPLNFRHTSSA
jgi:hypothetical protein